MRPVVALCLLAVAAALPARSATLRVCPDGSGDFPSLQAALDVAVSGDILELCDGVFTGYENADLVFGNRSLTLRSLHGPEATTIDFAWLEDGGGGFDELIPHPGIQIGPGGAARIEGVTLARAGSLTYERGAVHAVGAAVELDNVHIVGLRAGADRGAGVFVEDGSLSVADCSFRGNKARLQGGAIYSEGSALVVQRSTFTNNGSCSWDGGVIRLDEGGLIEDCIFEDNGGWFCGSNPAGKVLVAVGGELQILRCRFTDNIDLSGGCASIRPGATVAFEGCLFEGGLGEAGGLISLGGGRALFRNSTFRNNGSAWTGAAISGGGTLVLDGCVFHDNRCYAPSTHNGAGAITLSGHDTEVTVTRCTFVRNGTNGGSSIALLQEVASLHVDHSIFAFGGQPGSAVGPIHCVVPPRKLAVTCTDIHGNGGGDWIGCLAGSDGADGHLSLDPVFCGPDSNDFRLHAGSPCAPEQGGDCGLIGALGVGCGATATRPLSWGAVKALYR